MNNKIPSLNLGASRQVENPQAIRNGIRLARAEAFLMQSAIDTTHTAHNAVFQEDKFCLVATYQTNNYDSGQDVTQTIGIQMKLENFIGLGEDEFDPFKEIKTILSDFLSSPNPAPYVFPLSSQYKSGKIMWSKNMKPKNSICYRTVTDVCLAQIRKDILEHFPKSADGFILPMLGLYAIKLSYLHGHTYSVEAAADELYDLGLVNEPDFDEDHLPSPQLSSEILSPTTPQCFNDFKYGFTESYWLQGQNMNYYGVCGETMSGTWLPISFWRYSGCAYPITLPCPQTAHTPIINEECIKENQPIYLTEFPIIAIKNSSNRNCVVSWFGGELNLKYADFTIFNGKKVIYLLLLADDDESEERAYRVMLKAFAHAYKYGNRSFDCLMWDAQETVSYETLFSQALERGYLDINQEQINIKRIMENTLPWPNREPGNILFGRAYQSGRIHLIVAERGVGKTEMQLLYSVMAVYNSSIDDAFFANRSPVPIRVLYVQSEMSTETDFRKDRIPFALRLIAQNTSNAAQTRPEHDIEFYQTEGSLVKSEEQYKLLKRLAELDPKGTAQWMLVIDPLRREMPEVLNGGNIFNEKVFPWLDFLRKKGVAISLLHHENQAGDISGPGSLQDLADLVFHIVRTDKETANGEADVHIVQEKLRLLKGKQQATAHWNWMTDETGIVRFSSEYLDDDVMSDASDTPSKQSQSPDSPAPQATVEEIPSETSSLKLPTSLDELKAMPKDRMRVALFELWSKHETQDASATALKCSKSSLSQLMRDCDVNMDTYQLYLKERNGYA